MRPPAKIDKHVLCGGEALIARPDWVPSASALHGTDADMFESPTIERAFQRVLEVWRPRSEVMLTSLCTSTRPYTASKKWWTYHRLFGANVDLVVCSNGGIVPLPFESEYPFLNYDAKGQSRFDRQYIEVVGARLYRFIRMHRYRFVIFAFLQGMRNRIIAEDIGPQLVKEGAIEGYSIMPSDQARQQARDEGAYMAPGFRMYPDLWPCVLEELSAHVRQVCLRFDRVPVRVSVPENALQHHRDLRRPKGFFT